MVSLNVEKRLDNKGFTLAELLITVAIVVILLAIAIPSILMLQRNLLMDEANNAAEAIANAAQLEMTSMKADGTWASTVRNDDGNYKNAFPEAAGETGTVSRHARYMTAATARDLGILPKLSVEDGVRDASYIIEFDGLTASVTRVYYTTGATGFFNVHINSGAADQSVLDYYKSNPGEDDQSARLSFESCTIGKYVGTPDGATPSVALVKPSVSVNDYGKIILTNPNMVDAGDANSAIQDLTTQVTFEYPISDSENYSFMISGMTKNYSGDTYTIKASDGTNEYTCSFPNAPASNTSVYTVESNSRFELDLNDLVSVLEDNKENDQALNVYEIVLAIQNKSLQELQSKLEAVCTVSAKDCLSVKGRAFVDWPAKVPTLKVYVTDPDPRNVDTAALNVDESKADNLPDWINGEYTSPNVTLVDKNKKPVESSVLSSYTGLISESMLKATYSLTNDVWVNGTSGQATKLPVVAETYNVLLSENLQEGGQTYSGKTIKIETAKAIDANVLVTVGSYKSKSGTSMSFSNSDNTITYEGGSKTKAWSELKWPTGEGAESEISAKGTEHDYQIFEVWLDDGITNHRVGYFQGKNWVWDDADGVLSDCVRSAEGGTITEDTTQLIVDSDALMRKVGVLSKYKNYSLYVRTAPKASEVLDWFDEHAYTFANYVGWNSNTTDQRGKNHGRPIRWLMAYEFGAPTTVAAWTVSTGFNGDAVCDEMKDMGGQYFPTKDTIARIYYSTLPAVGWDIGKLDSRYLDLPNAQMMLYRWTGLNKTLDLIEFSNDQKEKGIYSHSVNGQMLQVRATITADIAITPKYDYMFYRVLTYFDSDGKTRFTDDQLTNGSQYSIVPLDGAGDARFPEGPQKAGMAFTGWKVTGPSGTFIVDRNEDGAMPKISEYVDQMRYGAVSLVAQYREGCNEDVGLVYVDNYDNGDGASLHYTGYLNANAAYVDDAAIDAGSITPQDSFESGYYLAYCVGTNSAPLVDVERSTAAWDGKMAVSEAQTAQVNIGGKDYALYKVTFYPSSYVKGYVQVKATMKGSEFPSATFYCNSLFGGMVARSEDYAKKFGTSDDPWRVYNTDMFPGVMQSTMQGVDLTYLRKLLENNSTVANSTNHYVQMRNLDFESVGASLLKQWPVAFSGTYDGGNHTIRNAQNAFTSIPYLGGPNMNKLGTASIGAETPTAYSTGLFPGLCGKDKDNPAKVEKLNVEFGDCSSGSQMFAVVSGYANQASFSGITVTGSNASDAPGQAHVTLTGMGAKGTTELFNASGAVVGRAEKCFTLEDCSVNNIAFDYVDSKLSLGNNRNVFGGIAGVFDATGNSNTDIPKVTTKLEVKDVTFNLMNSLELDNRDAFACFGGLFGRLYVNGGNCDFKTMNWSVINVVVDNESELPDSAVYAGILAGSYGGGTVRVYDDVTVVYSDANHANSKYMRAGNTLDMVALFNENRRVESGGLLSGAKWCFVNEMKVSDALAEYAKLPAGASVFDNDPADLSSSASSSSAGSSTSASKSASAANSSSSSASGPASSGADKSSSTASGSTSSGSSSTSNTASSTGSSSGVFAKVDDAA